MTSKIPKQEEIWLVDFNRKKVKKQSKIRPAIVQVTIDRINIIGMW